MANRFRGILGAGCTVAAVLLAAEGLAQTKGVGLDVAGPAVETARRVVGESLQRLEQAPGREVPQVGAAFVDLGDKAGAALVVRIEHGVTCGRAGCQTVVYRRDGGQWKKAMEAWTNTLAVRPGGAAPYDIVADGVTVWRWNGRAYQAAGAAR